MKFRIHEIKHTFLCLKVRMILFCLFILLSISCLYSREIPYGLKFKSYNYEPEKRTGLHLSPDNFLSFPTGFSLYFDMMMDLKEVHSYGYVFRITDKKARTIDLVVGEKNISFSSSLGEVVFTKTIQEVNLHTEEWVTIRLIVDNINEKLQIQFGRISEEWNVPEIRDFTRVDIVFGRNSNPERPIIDVPRMIIKDVNIDNCSGKPLYSWKLGKYVAGGVFDELKHHFALCENPDWILTHNAIWKKETAFVSERNPYLTYNPDNNQIAVADQHTFYTFSLHNSQLHEQKVQKGFMYSPYANQMIYNPMDSIYYIYNLLKEEEGLEFAAFNPSKSTWEETTVHKNYSDYWHHNRYFSALWNRLYLFGGYGHHKYKKGAYIYDVKKKAWLKEEFKGDEIAPRYLSGLGVMNESQLLLFGGYGSKTGNQDLSPQHYYDAFIINLPTLESKKLWTLATPEESFVVSNSLVVDTLNNCFYALCYDFTKFNTSIRLFRFSMDKPEYEIMADSIPFGFKDGSSYVDLFFDSNFNKLIAVTSFTDITGSKAEVAFYSLAFPPLQKSDLYQTQKKGLPVIIISTFVFL